MRPWTRRDVVVAAGAAAGLSGGRAGANTLDLDLVAEGAARLVPPRLFGAQAEAWFEPMLGDGTKAEAIRRLGLAYTRFAGGSQASFYDWRTGRLNVPLAPDASGYRRFWETLAPRINAFYADGLHYADYAGFMRPLGLETIFVPNLETDSLASQTEWMRTLAAQGLAPRWLELANEPFYALLADPTSMKRWPDAPTSFGLMRRYAEAFRPHLPGDVRICLPCADEGFTALADPGNAFVRRLESWNGGMPNEDWFSAVSMHPYVSLDSLLGPGGAAPAATPEQARLAHDALVARYDSGLLQAVDRLARRFPGKEVWLTEWTPRGGMPGSLAKPEAATPAILLQATVRACLAILRDARITVSIFFSLNFTPETNIFSSLMADGAGGFAPLPWTLAMGWIASAAHGAHVQRLVERHPRVRPGGPLVADRFAVIEAARFTRQGQETIIVQNAGPEPAMLCAAALAGRPPDEVEVLALPDLMAWERRPAAVAAPAPADPVPIAPYSVSRLLWRS